MADSSLIQAIATAAAQTGADAQLLVATALVESGATWHPAPGDNGTSFGPFMFHIGGALGSNPPSWASTYAAVLNRAQAFAGIKAATGADAARVQIPANPAQYAAKVNAALPEAAALLAQNQNENIDPGTAAADFAQTMKGTAYSFGGGSLAGPSKGTSGTTGFDCSGLVLWVYGQLGITLPHNAAQQYQLGVPVAKNQLKPGDLVFFEPSSAGPQHEGIYIGNDQFVAAPHTGATVATFSLSARQDYVGARRIVAPASVDRNGKDVAAVAGGLLPADKSQLVANAKKIAQFALGGGFGGTISNAAGGALSDATSSVTGAITGAVSDVESKVGLAATWVALVGLGVALLYLGTKRAFAPDAPGLTDLAKLGAAA